jgi:lipopolysaccharide/colanic/teichoic acid biosynthesis glycosyltransferase
MAVLLAPILAGLAAAIRLTMGSPVLFRQLRPGYKGEPFEVLKFRTMREDEDLPDDERLTPVGKFARQLSLDELPQLWNVVAGSMSLVGPRPPLPTEYGQYHDQVHRRLRVKPGITGLWQVSGRADLSWDESIRLDLRYVDNWSIALDLQILWKTARAVLGGSGAY